jgi:hypothetical protein
VWDPETFKLRYFPIESFDQVEEACREILIRGHAVPYMFKGDDEVEIVHSECEECAIYAWLPKFAVHQNINNRESASSLPDPHSDECLWLDLNLKPVTRGARVGHASATREGRVPHATSYISVGKEGKGKERKGSRVDDASPSYDDVLQFFQSIQGSESMAKSFFTHYDGDWTTASGEPLSNWKNAARAWLRRERNKPPADPPRRTTPLTDEEVELIRR